MNGIICPQCQSENIGEAAGFQRCQDCGHYLQPEVESAPAPVQKNRLSLKGTLLKGLRTLWGSPPPKKFTTNIPPGVQVIRILITAGLLAFALWIVLARADIELTSGFWDFAWRTSVLAALIYIGLQLKAQNKPRP